MGQAFPHRTAAPPTRPLPQFPVAIALLSLSVIIPGRIAAATALIPHWNKPIVIGRHAFGDQYKATDFRVPSAGKLTVTFTPKDGSKPMEFNVFDFPSSGVAMAMYNLDDSIRDFARASFNYGLIRKYPVFLSTKNTILKKVILKKEDIK